jgi:hypothetical protein
MLPAQGPVRAVALPSGYRATNLVMLLASVALFVIAFT